MNKFLRATRLLSVETAEILWVVPDLPVTSTASIIAASCGQNRRISLAFIIIQHPTTPSSAHNWASRVLHNGGKTKVCEARSFDLSGATAFSDGGMPGEVQSSFSHVSNSSFELGCDCWTVTRGVMRIPTPVRVLTVLVPAGAEAISQQPATASPIPASHAHHESALFALAQERHHRSGSFCALNPR